MQVVEVVEVYPGDAYYKKKNIIGSYGVFKKEKTLVNAEWFAGWLIPVDTHLIPESEPIFFVGVRVKMIKGLSNDEKNFWLQTLRDHKEKIQKLTYDELF